MNAIALAYTSMPTCRVENSAQVFSNKFKFVANSNGRWMAKLQIDGVSAKGKNIKA
jgi:hypothetical protein